MSECAHLEFPILATESIFLAQASIHDFTMEIRCYLMPMGKSSLEQTKLEKHGLSVEYEYVHQRLLSLPI
jgi:hypothetical protein